MLHLKVEEVEVDIEGCRNTHKKNKETNKLKEKAFLELEAVEMVTFVKHQ